MIASVLTLSRSDCKILKITDPYSVHRVVYSLFPKEDDKQRDFLFADKGGDFYSRKILLLSQKEPYIPEYGVIESKEIPDSFLDYEHYGFELLINPVKRQKETGKIIPVKGKENLINWFCEKSTSFGFIVQKESLSVLDTDVLQFKKNDTILTFGKAKFVGKLKVIDKNLFKKSFEQGLGRGKSFGFGLLQIVPVFYATKKA